MSGIEIIGPSFSSYVWVVRMTCEEKGVAYTLVPAALQSRRGPRVVPSERPQ